MHPASDQSKKQCVARTSSGATCQRVIASNAKYCWQHAKGLQRIRSLTKNQTIGFCLTLFFGIVAILSWIQPDFWKSSPTCTLHQRTAALAEDLYDWAVEQEGAINSWKQQALAQAFLDSMHNNQGDLGFQQRLSASIREAEKRFSSYYWPRVSALQDELRASGVDTTLLSNAEASNDPPRVIALALSVLANRVGKKGPFSREITPLEMKLLVQQTPIRNVEVYAYLPDANSRQVAETLRSGFNQQTGFSVNNELYPLEAKTPQRHGLWVVYPSADWTTEPNGLIPALDECQLESNWEIRPMKQPPSIIKFEVWPETPNWKPLAGPNLIQ
jgi:hypothetical protein